jgi:hypothetical protein
VGDEVSHGGAGEDHDDREKKAGDRVVNLLKGACELFSKSDLIYLTHIPKTC